MNDKTINSKLIQKDEATEQCYVADGFNPKIESENFSYTSARVMKPVYNEYKSQGKPKVFGYYTDWSQYDGRLDNKFEKGDRGAGYDLANVPPTAYDKIIFGFVGIVGDQGEKKNAIAKAAEQQNKQLHEPVFLDTWGDFQSHRNCAQPEAWRDIDVATVTQNNAKGVLGGLRDLQQKAKKAGHNLALAMSIGGWTMSNAFHGLAEDAESRKIFALGVVKLFKQFPMFSEVDIDWEYPGDKGNNNPFGPKDGANYVLLIKELREQLDAAGRSDVKISIAACADVKKIVHSNIKELLNVGLYGINLMSYDFFGTPWAEKLAHHTNLMPSSDDANSSDAAIQYLINEGVPAERINIGYAGYSRNGQNAQISNFSPLTGTYEPQGNTTTGTLESGTSVWADIIYNYLDLENQCGRNGFNVYTDRIANADYLYNPISKLFMSIDTPRTVKAKGEYALKHNLGGIFTWTIDQDNGVLVNAAREGLGCEIEKQTIDMQPFYFEGINVEDKNHPPKADIALQVTSGSVVQLTAEGSFDEDGDKISYKWTVPAGIHIPDITKEVIEFEVPDVEEKTQYSFELIAQDTKGAVSDKQYFILTVVKAMDIQPDPKPDPTPEPDVLNAPTDLKPTEVGTTSVNLIWKAPVSTHPIKSYTIYRDGKELEEITTLNFTDKMLEEETSYNYSVCAKNINGLVSPMSAEVMVKTKKSVAPDDEYPEWEANNHPYDVGDKVMYLGRKYVCINKHNSNSGWNPVEAFTLWSPIK